MKKSLGFTLAEVLITLAIIGVVAAMTVPSVIQNTNQQEYRTATKKAITTLNQALTMNIAVNQTSPAAIAAGAEYETLLAYFEDVLNAVEVNGNVVTTQDGMQYDFGDSVACTAAAPCTIYVDLNGRKAPSTASTPETSYSAANVTTAVTGALGEAAPTLVAALDEDGRFPAASIIDAANLNTVTYGEIIPLLVTDTAVYPGSNVVYAAMYQK